MNEAAKTGEGSKKFQKHEAYYVANQPNWLLGGKCCRQTMAKSGAIIQV